MAGGLPLVTFPAEHAGWRTTFAAIGAACAGIALTLFVSLSAGVRGPPISLGGWLSLAHRRLVVLLLVLTIVQVSGQFVIFTYMAPLLIRDGKIGGVPACVIPFPVGF